MRMMNVLRKNQKWMRLVFAWGFVLYTDVTFSGSQIANKNVEK